MPTADESRGAMREASYVILAARSSAATEPLIAERIVARAIERA